MSHTLFQKISDDLSLYRQTGEKTPLLFLFNYRNASVPFSVIYKSFLKSPTTPAALKKTPQAAYFRLYRALKQLVSEGIFHVDKRAGNLIWVVGGSRALDLFKQAQNSNRAKQDKKNPSAYPMKARPERIEGVKIAKSIHTLPEQLKEKIANLFQEYLDDIAERVNILKAIYQENEFGPPFLYIPYETRFNSKQKKARLISQYEEIIENSLAMYETAVHLVLTTDPKRFNSLWEANRHFSKALNRFLSFLKKHLKERPKYLAVYEFTKTGLLHAHILIFGVGWLLPHHQITEEWEKCGQGSYNYIYKLKATPQGWQYARQRPRKTNAGQTADDYLKKYLLKSQYDESSLFLYWVFNKRYYTNSRALMPDKPPRSRPIVRYEFIGSFYALVIPEWVIEAENAHSLQLSTKPPPWRLKCGIEI